MIICLYFAPCAGADVHNLVSHRFHPKQIPVLSQAAHRQSGQGRGAGGHLLPACAPNNIYGWVAGWMPEWLSVW